MIRAGTQIAPPLISDESRLFSQVIPSDLLLVEKLFSIANATMSPGQIVKAGIVVSEWRKRLTNPIP